MSQIYKNSLSSPVPPDVPTTFITDVNSPAVPAANILDVPGAQTSEDNNNGIQTDGSSGGNILTIQLTNRLTDNVITTDATLTTLLTFALPEAGVYYVFGNVQAYNASGPAGGTYSFSGGYLTDGVTATELGTEFQDTFESPSFVTADIFLDPSGNNVVLSVQGIAATVINWNAILEFRKIN